MAEIEDLDIVDASNTARFPEGIAAGQLNNASRALEGILARGFKDAVEGDRDSTGSANAYLVAANRTISAYHDGMRVGFHANFACTGPSTLSVDAVGAKNLLKYHDQALANGDIEINQYVEAIYSATDDTFQMLSPVAVAPLLPTGDGSSLTNTTLPRSYLAGLALSNGTDATNDIDIAVGEARSTADDANLVVASAIGKQIDASWAAGGTPGTPTGGLSSTLTLTNDTWYHVILGLVSGTAEIGFDTSITGATLASDHSFTNTRRIGSVRRGTATNLAFIQSGDKFLLDVSIGDHQSTDPGTAATIVTLTVPLGLVVDAIMSLDFKDDTAATGADSMLLVTSPDQTDTAPSVTVFTLAMRHSDNTEETNSITGEFMTNTSSQIRYRLSASNADIVIRITLHGWVDRRGRDD